MKQRQAVGILADLVAGGGKRADIQMRREARYAKSEKAIDPKGRKARGDCEHGDPTMKQALRRKQVGINSRTRARNGL
jgi:hypothetical protein